MGMLPVSWHGHQLGGKRRERGRKEGKSMFSEKTNSVQTLLLIFAYGHIEMWVGAESVCVETLGQNE